MDNDNVGKYRMYYVFAAFLKSYKAIFGDVKKLAGKIAVFQTVWKALIDIVPDESVAAQDTKPITINKNQLFDQLKKKLTSMGKLGKLFAEDKNDPDLEADYSFIAKDLEVGEPQLIALAKELLTHFKANATELLDYGMTADEIPDLEVLITLAEQNIGKPQSLKVQISISNTNVNEAFDKVDTVVKGIKKQIEGVYGEGMKTANKEIIRALTKSVKVQVVKRFTGIRFLFLNEETKEPIPGVAVDIPALKKKGLGGLDAKVAIIKMKTTESLATYTHKEYETKTANLKAVKGKIIDVVVELEKKK